MATMTPVSRRAFPAARSADILRGVDAVYGPDQFVEQQSFMRASEILALARRAGVAPGVSVLDLCCGVAGPGRFITRQLCCTYLGVDASSSAIDIARERAGDLPCQFEVARVPPLPSGRFDVVLLLETMLAFRDKAALVREISEALTPGGRFAFTLEEGRPLAEHERERMPDAGTVWLTPLDEMVGLLERAGLVVTWHEDHSRPHRETAQALAHAYAAQMDRDDLVTTHRLWVEWFDAGRVRKFALIAQRKETP